MRVQTLDEDSDGGEEVEEEMLLEGRQDARGSFLGSLPGQASAGYQSERAASSSSAAPWAARAGLWNRTPPPLGVGHSGRGRVPGGEEGESSSAVPAQDQIQAMTLAVLQKL